MDKDTIKEIKDLLNEIKDNQYINLRNSEYYEPWDISDSTKDSISDACYYKLMKCIDLLKALVDDYE
mgnify:CR=1 FL=1